MSSIREFVFFIILSLFFHAYYSPIHASSHSHTLKPTKPCKTLDFFFHDILYNGHNSHNATSALVGVPAWANRTFLASQINHFGDLVVFDNPITLDNNLHSKPIGRAQGIYVYDNMNVFSAWFGFSCVFNSTQHKGTINFVGADLVMSKTRDISVIGGTGDFFMARGVATFMTDTVEGDAYFRLRVLVKLYECWKQ